MDIVTERLFLCAGKVFSISVAPEIHTASAQLINPR
jgi:hypothetical protein